MSPSTAAHRRDAPSSVPCAVITVSDTRTLQTDVGGSLVVEFLEAAGHVVKRREIVPDDPQQLGRLVETLSHDDGVDAILLTGGTGISRRDQTYETLVALFEKTLPGYGELFRMLSFDEIGAASMLSRAIGGLCGGTVVLSMPGSTAAVRLAMERLIAPELAHLVHEAGK
jgi:molybdenum cofactor biosynthesis protein B